MSETQNILMVDDSDNDLFLMRKAFAKAGFDIPLYEVHDGEQAIAYLSGDDPYNDRMQYPLPTVLLLDLNMPGKSGFDVLKWVRAQPGIKRLSIVTLSASMRFQDIERAFDCGTNFFFVKPTNLEGLVVMIQCLRMWMQINKFPSLTS